jgi:CRP-like cAMP-binding protein
MRNRLLDALPLMARRRLTKRLEQVTLRHGQVLHEQNEEMPYVYFPTSAMISLQNVQRDGVSVEAATQGNEGIVGIAAVLGVRQAVGRAMTHVAGEAYRLSMRAFRDEIDRLPPLFHVLGRYVHGLVRQIALLNACNACHTVKQRYIRRLLITYDASPADQVVAPQQVLADLIGVRRASISIVAGHLQTAGFLHYHHGVVTILSRRELERLACPCYRALAQEKSRLWR